MLHCNPEFLHVVRPKTPRGDGNHRGSPALDHAPLVVSSDPKPREGTETFCLMLGRQLLTKSSDPKPREGTETRKRRASSDRLLVVRPKTPRGDGNNTSVARHTPTNHQVVRPKTPRGDGNFSDHLCGISGLRSSDPKPREGTETPMRRHFRLQFQPVVRPKTPRGDGNLRRASTRGCRLRWSSDPKPREGTETGQRSTPALVDFRVVRPKTPRGDGNQVSNGGGNLAATGRSSDPKPREGTETWDICCPPGEMLSEVVRPKTPRGDGNFVDHHCHSLSPRVVRPKTPRGDGNLRQPFRCDADGRLGSSDPKPREGTETLNNAQ
ncbi:Uncharacterised protein [Mycobacterium tuberculosis]|nr:Uncharacterised protein [Mycobacterium tuberculosis]CFH90368.1 Uncharacterised protein [Mycobacterium tuberculosis]CFI93421.1 Uncharacterised protein [Mycobacterium tuberculosis]CLL02966.1 Uncharacterised protein [Mycobacterium tuberculosis]CLL55723.1 Uncharacterised protein [Mycobacterium tuberculosis]